MLEFQILTDNLVNRPHLLAEHGLSLWIWNNGRQILFDAGQTSVFLQNALSLGIPINAADAIVLSHGHYDHAGGIASYPFAGGNTKVYVGEKAFEKKLSVKDGVAREIGIPWSRDFRNRIGGRIVPTNGRRELFGGTFLLGDIGQYNRFESVSDCFYIQSGELRTKDRMDDEQMLVMEGRTGLAVFSGCSHKGIVNCVEHVKAAFPGRRISALIAGMHLRDAEKERLDATVDYLARSEIGLIVPLHCTGILPICELKKALKGRCRICATGDRVKIE